MAETPRRKGGNPLDFLSEDPVASTRIRRGRRFDDDYDRPAQRFDGYDDKVEEEDVAPFTPGKKATTFMDQRLVSLGRGTCRDNVSMEEYNRVIRQLYPRAERVLDHPRQFRNAMGIHGEHYEILKREGLWGSGTLRGALHDLWTDKATGPATKALFGVGIAGFPVGWLVVGGLTGAMVTGGAAAGLATAFAASRFWGKKKSEETSPSAREKVVPLVETPLDLLAERWARLICAIAMKMAYADDVLDPLEVEKTRSFLVDDFGYNPLFTVEAIDSSVKFSERFHYVEIFRALNETLRDFGKASGHLLKRRIMELCEKIAASDGIIDPSEREEIENMKFLLDTSK